MRMMQTKRPAPSLIRRWSKRRFTGTMRIGVASPQRSAGPARLFSQGDVAIDIMGLPVCRIGLTVEFDEDEPLRRFEEPEVVIDVDLGAGNCATTMWTCDFSHEYVTINGDYRS